MFPGLQSHARLAAGGDVALSWAMVSNSFKWVFPKIVGFTPKSSILIGFTLINHPFWGTPIFGNTHGEDFFQMSFGIVFVFLLSRQEKLPAYQVLVPLER